MASVKLVSLVVFMLALICMFLTKNVGATCIHDECNPFEWESCGSSSCACIPTYGTILGGICTGSLAGVNIQTIIEEHPNLCESHVDCIKKESGNFCARYPNPDIEYGWCFASKSETEDIFFEFSSNYNHTNDVKNTATA